MGLPLWQPKVESDIPIKPEVKDSAHQRYRVSGRSRGPVIRDRATALRNRHWLESGELQARERRRLAAERQLNIGQRGRDAPVVRQPDLPSDMSIEGQQNRYIARVMAERRLADAEDADEDRESRRAARLMAPRVPPPPHRDPYVSRHLPHPDVPVRDEFLARTGALFGHAEGGEDRIRDSIQLLSQLQNETGRTILARSYDQVPGAREALERIRQNLVRSDITSEADMIRALPDGLGDRDRSLSPGGDNAWDTLLTTVTPDPQPPSVGSSFVSASASASAVASQSAVPSSGTSLTGPDTAEESIFEHEQPCDSDEDVDPTIDDFTSLRSRLHANVEERMARRAGDRHEQTYADAVRGNNSTRARDESDSGANDGGEQEIPADAVLQFVGGIGGMQHILRSLAQREDIPNEWWVSAGLSRSIPPRDRSSN